jgi:hypothetical protein
MILWPVYLIFHGIGFGMIQSQRCGETELYRIENVSILEVLTNEIILEIYNNIYNLLY